MDEDALDYQLRQLVSEAQQHPSKTAEQGKVLNKLVKTIQNSGNLNRFSSWQNYPNFQDIYDEALARTFTEICKNIHNYRPEHRVMAWVNKILYYRFRDVLRITIRLNGQQILSLDELASFNHDSES